MELNTVTATLGDHVRDAVVITEAEPTSRPGPRMVWVNDAFTRMTGYTLEEVSGQSPRILQRGDADPKARAAIRAALAAWRPVRQTLRNYTKDGRMFWVDLDIRPLTDSSGWRHYWISVQRDVTEQVEQAEALRRARVEADAADQLKSRFLANLSHEIRTPLNGVLGMAQVLALTRLDDDQKRAVDIIAASGRSLLALIEDMLDLSSLEAGGITLAPEPVTANALIQDAAAAVRGACLEKGLTLRLEPGDGARTPFLADPGGTRRILAALAGNAVKFTPSGTVILASRAEPGAMVFEVRDTGPGVPPARREAIFERFRQGDSSTSRSHAGAGLGLAIASELATLAGARLEVDAAPEGGALFRLTLPLHGAEVPSAEPAHAPAADIMAPDRPQRVLLVEDSAVNREVITQALGLNGWTVIEEERAEPALARLGCEPFDLVIMDRDMPDLDGETAIRALRALDAPVRGIPVLMVSAHADADARAAALAAGADDYLAKPVMLDALLDAADRLTQGRK